MDKFVKLATMLSVGLIVLNGCASKDLAHQQAHAETEAATKADARDPLESVNRAVWDFNYDVLDAYFLRPVTVGYMTVVPKPARKGLVNMANNLNEPASFINGALQAKPDRAAISAARFLVNSTLGIFGLFDVATRIGLVEQNEDFGQTMAVWGVADGPYLMVPALGPNTGRNLVGDTVDNLYFPMTLLSAPLAIGRVAVQALDGREQLMSMEQLLDDSLDPYAFIKESFYQRMQFKIYDGNPPKPPEPEVDEDAFDDILDGL